MANLAGIIGTSVLFLRRSSKITRCQVNHSPPALFWLTIPTDLDSAHQAKNFDMCEVTVAQNGLKRHELDRTTLQVA